MSYNFVIHPVENKKGIVFTFKKDKRRKRKPVYIEFEMDGGIIFGYFTLAYFEEKALVCDGIEGGELLIKTIRLKRFDVKNDCL